MDARETAFDGERVGHRVPFFRVKFGLKSRPEHFRVSNEVVLGMKGDGMVQTILGAGGIIGTELARELNRRGKKVRLVGRRPPELQLGEERLAADMLDGRAVNRAVEGSAAVYLTLGLPYDSRAWKAQWPAIMGNVMSACREAGVRLVFFDNVYMYGPVEGWMTEQTPMRPVSQKGRVRAALAQKLLEEAGAGLDVRIARSADFYGPGARNGIPNLLVFDNLAKGRNPQWLVSGKFRHSMTYTKDAARATAELGLRDALPGGRRIWHLPTDSNPWTLEQWAREAAKGLSVPEKPLRLLKPWMILLGGLFQRQVKELGEMLYQYDRDYLFASGPFEKEFGIPCTPTAQGIRETAESCRR
jgi:nucleoside-diphosphate-sugar epimerase